MPPNPPTAAIKTLGCKLNQFESQQIREQLVRLGFSFVPFESVADVYIINSCTVTARTDRDCRRLIRHAHKLNPEAFIAVTGCYAQVHREQLEAIPEADLVVGNDGKASLGHRIVESISPELLESQPDLATVLSDEHHSYADGEMLEGFAEHSRAFLKVQEGCDAHCAYCIIPQARGTSRSVPPGEVLDQAQRLIEAGFAELVLVLPRREGVFPGLRPSPFAEKHLPERGTDIPVRACPPCTGWKTRAPVPLRALRSSHEISRAFECDCISPDRITVHASAPRRSPLFLDALRDATRLEAGI